MIQQRLTCIKISNQNMKIYEISVETMWRSESSSLVTCRIHLYVFDSDGLVQFFLLYFCKQQNKKPFFCQYFLSCVCFHYISLHPCTLNRLQNFKLDQTDKRNSRNGLSWIEVVKNYFVNKWCFLMLFSSLFIDVYETNRYPFVTNEPKFVKYIDFSSFL